MQLHLQVPEHLTGKNQQQLEALVFEALVVRLYVLGEPVSGEGAKLLGLMRPRDAQRAVSKQAIVCKPASPYFQAGDVCGKSAPSQQTPM